MKPFKFKEFSVYQDKTAMKIGTDGVLLGAWSLLPEYPDTILDIGSGTGVIGLMLAQRSDAMTVDAVEIDADAYEQTVANFEQSPWGDRLFCYNTSFADFAQEIAEEQEFYDVIVSNPPFYTDTFETQNEARNKARFTSSLSFEELLKGVAQILSKRGVFSVIIPFKEEADFIDLAKKYRLFLKKVCRVKGTENSEIKRSLLAFSFSSDEIKEDNNQENKAIIIEKEELIIEKQRHQYTDAYINLTKDFYLKM
ncbi:methyltransferase [Tenacibaculum finnmarkense genomovar ulcerans]|uniref:tRNA1(Val) (adenine(37)-N6)-methyltransferase n=1 Tax=Tenacibaculum finnmarkense TaxID=2781243 RepID=UPI001E312984|nr:methyltransferase [Tenacibaculum finnmarkense]MCD8431419.1 methyltransferase [Tenacibaculum finnmarkense genomovar ulcerans]